jgi:hypothetical protein
MWDGGHALGEHECNGPGEQACRLAAATRPIPCAERMPRRSEYVWCWAKSGPDARWVEGQWFGHYWETYRFGVIQRELVTHWLPKPPAPGAI